MNAFILFRISFLISRYRNVIAIKNIHVYRDITNNKKKKNNNKMYEYFSLFRFAIKISVFYVFSLLICHTYNCIVVSLFIQRIVEIVIILALL